jgi:hypothetical protein
MKLFDKLFKANPATGSQKAGKPAQNRRVLRLEGTPFFLTAEQAAFLEVCRTSGQAALVTPFSGYWQASRDLYQAKLPKQGERLLCSACLIDMPMSFRFNLPGGMQSGGWIAVGEGLPSNLPAAVKAARCPYCGSDKGILLYDYPDYGEITETDMEAMRALWRFRCELWWNRNQRAGGICDDCNAPMKRGEGYHNGSSVVCQDCAMKSTGVDKLESLRKNPDWFGESELRKARNFISGAYRLERGEVVSQA